MEKTNEVRSHEWALEVVYDRLAKAFPDNLTSSDEIAAKEGACETLDKMAERMQFAGEDDADVSKKAQECGCELVRMTSSRDRAHSLIGRAIAVSDQKDIGRVDNAELEKATRMATEAFQKSLDEALYPCD